MGGKKTDYTRRDFLKVVGIAAASLAVQGCENTPQTACLKGKRPNIVYILADDLGYGDLGCYGQGIIKTPNLDQMAAQGILFTDHYAGSTVCAPSRCVLMTGCHTGHAYLRGNGPKVGKGRPPLRPTDVTVANVLSQAGYATGLIGKWGLGDQGTTGAPNRQGFDYFFGYVNQSHAHNYYPAFMWRNDKKVILRNIVVQPDYFEPGRPGGASTNCVEYSHDMFSRESLDFVHRNKNRPFFLYLAYTIPHANNEAPRVLDRHGMEVPGYGIYEDRDWPEAQKGHAAMITRMDRDIGRLFDKLKQLGIDDNTLVMFSSDNGPHKEGGADPDFFKSAGPLRGIKRDLYEGGIRVPMIARWPGIIKPGSVSNCISAFWDILPTCAELAAVEAPDGIDGVSFVPTLLGKKQNLRDRFLCWEFHERGFGQAVRWRNFKAVRMAPDEPLELYDLAKDISEQRNVASQHPDVIARIEACLKTARTESYHWPIKV